MNKRLLIFLFAGCIITNNTSKTMEVEKMGPVIAQTFAPLMGIAAAGYLTKYVSERPTVHRLFEKSGISPFAASNVILLSLSAYAGSFVTQGGTSDLLRHLALTAPWIGLVNALLKKPIIRKNMSKIYFFGPYLTCPLATKNKVVKAQKKMSKNGFEESEISLLKKCTGSCSHCQATDAVRLLVGWQIAKHTTPYILDYLKTKIGYGTN